MTCTDAVVLLHLHRPGERSEDEERALENHLRTCESCSAEASLVQGTMSRMDVLTHAPSPDVHVSQEIHHILQEVQRQNRPGFDVLDSILRAASHPGIRLAYAIMCVFILAMMMMQVSPVSVPSEGPRPMTGPYISYTIDTEPLAGITDLPVPESIKTSVLEHRTLQVRKTDVDRSVRLLERTMLRTLSLSEQQRRLASTVIDGLSRSSALTIRFGRIGG